MLLPRICVALAANKWATKHPEEALRIAHQVLARTRGRDLVTARLALLALARIHGEHPSLLDPACDSGTPALHCLRRLWELLAGNRD
jgi:hypothetical protein